MNKRAMNSRGQIAIFVIIGILIVGGAIAYFVLRDSVAGVQVPANLEPVYSNFLNCLEEDVLVGIDILESQGGYITIPDFEPGSNYMPFSSQLNFLGNAIPYWYYLSGNNIQREQVPKKSEMESALEDYLENKIQNCVYDNHYQDGFEIIQGSPNAEIKIEREKVFVSLDMDLSISRSEDSIVVSKHDIEVKSQMGKLYESALKIYKQEQETLFLENYAVDTLRLYAPVDGVELTCAPKIWNAEEVFDDLKDAIEVNTLSLRNKNNDFILSDSANKYFVLDLGVDESVRFITSKNWPSAFEVAPSEGPVLRANPVGNQPGMGIIGFCYVKHHFVYGVKYPVLIQVYSEDATEIFQFPMAVVIQGNIPREPLNINLADEIPKEFCKDKNSLMQVSLYDSNLNSVEGKVAYSCLGEVCDIGATSNGVLEDYFPQCVNGFLIVEAEGFADSHTMVSSVDSSSVDVILDRLYEREVELKLDSKVYAEQAIVSFVSDKVSATIIYPEQKSVELVEGQYNISVSVYRESELKISATTSQQCYEVPRSGLGGLVGLTEEECVDLEIPEQILSNALAGGGVQAHYILEGDLQANEIIEINAKSLPTPKSLEELQDNYILYEEQNLRINFK